MELLNWKESYSANGCVSRAILRRPRLTVAAFALAVLCAIARLYSVAPLTRSETNPAQAWISIDPFDNSALQSPDVEIRQAWVRGSWMRALDKDILNDAESIQNCLVAGSSPCQDATTDKAVEVGAIPDLSVPSIGIVHSLFQFLNWTTWSGLEGDSFGAQQSRAIPKSPANITLRPASVLSDFMISSDRTAAADAIGITLICGPSSPAGRLWDKRAATLAGLSQSKWRVSQEPQTIIGDVLVRVQYRAAGTWDNLVFVALYGAAMLYAVIGLAKCAVIRSKLGLLASMVAEVSLATIAARVVSSALEISVATVPLAYYPVFAVAQCLCNVGRLLAKVQDTYPSKDTSAQICSALVYLVPGTVAVTTQAVLGLLLAAVVIPVAGLSSFFLFAAASLTIDLFVFITLSVAALTINLKEPGLHELGQVGSDFASADKRAPGLEVYRLTLAGLTFFAALHFIDKHNISQLLYHFKRLLYAVDPRAIWRPNLSSCVPPEAGNLVQWFRAQDPRTLQEFVQAVKPQSCDFVYRAYTPLLIATNVAERGVTIPGAKQASLLPTLSIGLPVMALAIFVLWHARFIVGQGDGENATRRGRGESGISFAWCLPGAQTLDNFILSSCARSFIVSVSFDRQIRLWDVQAAPPTNYVIMPSPNCPIDWPVSLVTISNDAEWLAFCSRSGCVVVWNRHDRRFHIATSTSSDGRVVSCHFVTTSYGNAALGHLGTKATTSLLLVHDTGRLVDLSVMKNDVGYGSVIKVQVSHGPVRSSQLTSTGKNGSPKLITVTKDRDVFISAKHDGWWATQPLRVEIDGRKLAAPTRPMMFSLVASLRGVATMYDEDQDELHLVDILAATRIHTYRVQHMYHRSLRAIHSPPQKCIYCGSTAIASFSIAYTEKKFGGGLTMITTTAAQLDVAGSYPAKPICLRSERDARERRCKGFLDARQTTYSLPSPGTWEATGANGIAGVRRELQPPAATNLPRSNSTIIRRSKNTAQRVVSAQEERWEAWTMTAQGVVNRHKLPTSLLAGAPGPICKLARNAVIVGLADEIVLVQFGRQLRDDDDCDSALAAPMQRRLLRRQSSSGKRAG